MLGDMAVVTWCISALLSAEKGHFERYFSQKTGHHPSKGLPSLDAFQSIELVEF
jgi:hypothetical protein